MSAGVLFDAAGPATRARHRIYTIAASVALAALAALVVWRLYESGQFEGEKWEPFVTPAYVGRCSSTACSPPSRWPSAR